MDCNLARSLLPFIRRGGIDLESPDIVALERHFTECPSCAAAGAAGQSFDSALARAMRDVPVPAGLSVKLSAGLRAARWARYSRLALGSTLAGMLLLGAGWAYSQWRRPVLDAGQLAQQTYQLNGLARTDEEARSAASDWLRLIDDRLQAPTEFNYKLLAFADRSALQGLTRVPTLVFARGDATMRVYVVRERTFQNLGDVREEVGGCTVETRRYDNLPGWVFILVTSGASPDAFRQPTRPLDPA
jgi:hypothetical protein